jgi:hypothetical protein
VEECLFFERDHEDRSMRKCVSYDDRIDWFTGNKAGTFLFPRWRILRERLTATARADLASRDRRLVRLEMIAFYLRRTHEGKALIKEPLINVVRALRVSSLMHKPRSRFRLEKW